MSWPFIHNNDLPENLDLGTSIAIDTETMGLNPHRDQLCLVQLSSGDGDAHLVKIAYPRADAPHLKSLLADPARAKLFHFARFDVAQILEHNIGPIGGAFIALKSRQISPHLYGSSWLERFVPRIAADRYIKATTIIGLGRGQPQ